MPTVQEIEQRLFQLAPRESAMDWDNVGHLLGSPEQEVTRILVALDITEAVADEAIAEGCQLIVAHHPVMNCKWLPVQTMRSDTPQGHLLMKLLTHDICAICMHTNAGLRHSERPDDYEKADRLREIVTALLSMREEWRHANGPGN